MDPDLIASYPLRTFWPAGSAEAQAWNAGCRRSLAPPRPLGGRLGPRLGRSVGLGRAGSVGPGAEYPELWTQGRSLGFFRGITWLYKESLGRGSIC